MKNRFRIAGRWIGGKGPCFIIAEAGINHNGSVERALQLVEAACASGADAVKFQTFSADEMVTPSSPKAGYQKKGRIDRESQYAMLKKYELSEKDFHALSDSCREKKIIFLSTPFDLPSVRILSRIGVPAYKISSGDLTNIPLLRAVAQQKKPVLLSTGMADLGEIQKSVDILRNSPVPALALLHCTSSYPCDFISVNLRAMQTLKALFHLPVGYSDHTPGIIIPVAAVAMGASIIEKHITMDKSLPGPDHAASLEPDEFSQMVQAIRNTGLALGNGEKKPTDDEMTMRQVARKSIASTREIPPGWKIRASDLAIKRPGSGLEPSFLDEVIGKSAKVRIYKDSIITRDMIE